MYFLLPCRLSFFEFINYPACHSQNGDCNTAHNACFNALPKALRPFCFYHHFRQFTAVVGLFLLDFGVPFGLVGGCFVARSAMVGALPYLGFQWARASLWVWGSPCVIDFNLCDRNSLRVFLTGLLLFLAALSLLRPRGCLLCPRFLLAALQHLSGRGAARI